MSVNKAILIGNVGTDPNIKTFESGNKNASFSLATSERFKDKSGEQKEQTEWHNIVCWGKTADVVEKYVKKGTQLYVEGSIRTRSYDGNDGQKHYITEITAVQIQMLGRKSDNQSSNQYQYQPKPGVEGSGKNHGFQPDEPSESPQMPEAPIGEDDDLPF